MNGDAEADIVSLKALSCNARRSHEKRVLRGAATVLPTVGIKAVAGVTSRGGCGTWLNPNNH